VHLASEVDGADGFAWAKSLRKAFRKLKAEGVHINDHEVGGLKGRLTDVTENLELVRPQKLGELKAALSLPDAVDGHIYTATEIESHLKTASAGNPNFFHDLQARIEKVYPNVINTLGGTAGDPYYRYVGRAGGYSQLAQLLQQAKFSAAEAPRRFAQLEAALMNFARITPAEWTEQAMAKTVSKRSKLYEILCMTGIYDPNSHYYSYYCKGAVP
jgi:hypothetical protein